MVEENLEIGDSPQVASLSSPTSVQNSVEPKPTIDTDEDDKGNLEKTLHVNFEASMHHALPASFMLIDSKCNLLETLVEQKAPIGDSITVLSEVDSSGFPSVKDNPDASNEVYESNEGISDLMSMQPPGEKTHAMSPTLVRFIEEVQCTPLHNVQDGTSCSNSENVTCEMPPAILTQVKEDKPRVMHRLPERQMSLGDTRQKAPVRRLNSGNYFRTDRSFVDTTNPIESVKVAASRFGGSINWKTRRTQPVQVTEVSDPVKLEVGRLKKEISECKQQAESTEAAKLSVLNEIDETNKIIEELKHGLERAQTEEAQAKEDLYFFQFIVPEMGEGASSNDSAAGKEILQNIQERHEAVVSKLKLVNDELQRVQEEYDSLLIELDISVGKSQAAVIMSGETERQAEELRVEFNKLKEVLNLARATCHDAEEQKMLTSLARDQDCLTWEKDLRQAEEELSQLDKKLSSVEDLKSKLETSSNLLLKLNKELTAHVEAKLIEEAQEQENRTHETTQEEIILSRNELKEHKKSIDKMRDEICTLKVTAASLQSELIKEKAALATMQQLEAMASITIRSLKVDIKLAQQELESVQVKEKDYRDRTIELPKILQSAVQETDEAKSVAMKAREKLRKTKEEVELATACLSTMEFRLQAVLKEMEAAKESERLALDALRVLEESLVKQQGSPRIITIYSDEHASLIEKSSQAEELVHQKIACSIAQVEVAKASESHSLSRMSEMYKVLEERKRALFSAKMQADTAIEGKMAMEQELRTWREENGQRRKASEALKSETKPSNAVVVIAEHNGNTKGTRKEDSCALIHPLSETSARASPDCSSLYVKTKKAKKLPFLRRVIMFLARRRLKAVE